MIVELNPSEMGVVHFMSTMRRCINQSLSVIDRRLDKNHQAIELEMTGMVAEMAWGKATNTYPDFGVKPRSGSIDSVIDGIRIDIKATTRTDGRLLATPKKAQNPADIYILAIVRENIVNFVGYAEAQELLDKSTLTDLGHGPTHALPQVKLHLLTDIVDLGRPEIMV
jgi:hypothetical protein